MNKKSEELIRILKDTGAFLTGHFLLSSGLHSPNYIQCALLLQHPEFAEKFGRFLAKEFGDKRVQTVISPALGGIIIGHEVARAVGVRAIFAERQHSPDGSSKMNLRRGFVVERGENVLVVEDVITTGGSTKEIIGIVKERGGNVVGVGCIVDRSGGETDFGVEMKSLLRLDMEVYSPEDCPLCKKGITAVKPGSR